MKTTNIILTCYTVLSLAPVFAQGSLTPPPGVPAPVMKTLDQVEARIPLVAGQPGVSVGGLGTISISDPGSYYLTGNLKIVDAAAHGIEVLSSHVSIDLNGYALICTTVNGGDAIHIPGASNVRISSGHIVGGSYFGGSSFSTIGWENGVFATAAKSGLVVTDLNVYGTRNFGIFLNDGFSRVERCTTSTTVGTGIHASSVINCSATEAGFTAISAPTTPGTIALIDNCIGVNVNVIGLGHGIFAPSGSVNNSQGKSISGDGIYAATVMNSQGVSVSGGGLHAIRTATNCTGTSDSDTGLFAEMAANNCHGYSVSGWGLVAQNSANCYGATSSGNYGILSNGTASFCYGANPGGTAISAASAIGCTKNNTGSINSPNKQLGTP